MRSPVPPRIAVWVLLVLLPLAGLAAPVTYTGSAPVNSQADDERASALRTALANVVIEQTADSAVLARADVAKAVERADRYVLQYSYRRNAGGDTPLTLEAEFDADAVDRMLQRLGLGRLADVAATPEAPSEATVWIGDIRDADDYARAIGYLGRNNFVKEVRPLAATADGILVRLALTTDLTHFLDIAGMERTLAPTTTRVDGADAALALAH